MCAAQHCSTLFISILQQPDRCQCTTLNSNDERYQEWPIGNTSNMSNHFWYRKYKFSVYFGIKIGVAVSTNTDLQSIGIKLKTLVSPITTDMQEHTELQNQTLPLTLSQTILVGLQCYITTSTDSTECRIVSPPWHATPGAGETRITQFLICNQSLEN